MLCQTHTRMHRGETTCFVKPIPECIEEKQLALSNPYQNASRRNDLLCQTHIRMHRGEATCFVQTHTRMYRGETTCFLKPIPECIEEKRRALSNTYQNASRRNDLLCQTHIRMHRGEATCFVQTHTRMYRGETTCFVKLIPECIEEKQLALSNPYQNASRRNKLLC